MFSFASFFLDLIRSNKAITQVLSMKYIPLLKYTSDFLVVVCGPQYFFGDCDFSVAAAISRNCAPSLNMYQVIFG
jgi:hypothetical protein